MKLLVLVLVVVIGYALFVSVRLLEARRVGHEAVAQAVAFQRIEGSKRVLIVGDSTAVGVGASNPEKSTAGLLAADFPSVSVENRAVSGAKLRDVVGQLAATAGTYDLVLIQAGANDVLYFSSDAAMKQGVTNLFAEARKKSDTVVVLTAGNIGLAPVIPWPFGYYISARTRYMRELMQNEAAKVNAHYVDLYKERGSDPFENDVARYYAPDRLHLSDDGYAYWYSEIRRQALLRWAQDS